VAFSQVYTDMANILCHSLHRIGMYRIGTGVSYTQDLRSVSECCWFYLLLLPRMFQNSKKKVTQDFRSASLHPGLRSSDVAEIKMSQILWNGAE
jgi:hypothetical protein